MDGMSVLFAVVILMVLVANAAFLMSLFMNAEPIRVRVVNKMRRTTENMWHNNR